MELNKIQKTLLFLIIFFSIVFVYQLAEASANSETIPETSSAATFSEQNQAQEPEQNTDDSEDKMDYGQPLSLPEEYYEQEETEEQKQNLSEEVENYSNETDIIQNETTNETNQINETEENETEENQTIQEPEHDLGISKLEAEPDEENPLKLKIKIQVKNYGKEKENYLHLLRIINNESKEYGPYDNEITYSSTRNYQKTFSENKEVNITFKILNYSNFQSDGNKTNNIKSITVNL